MALEGAQEMLVKIRPVHFRFKMPRKATGGSVGFDLFAALDHTLRLYAGDVRRVPCGFAMELPEGYEAQIRSRSGLAATQNVIVFNQPGTIDSDYRGEVCVLLKNDGSISIDSVVYINNGDRIAQMVIKEVPPVELELAEALSKTGRGDGGFGSSGGSNDG